MSEGSNQNQHSSVQQPRRRKPLWPWVLLLVLTLCAIYTYNQVTLIIETIRHQVPPEFLDILEWILRQGGLIPDNGRQAPDFAMSLPNLYGINCVQAMRVA